MEDSTYTWTAVAFNCTGQVKYEWETSTDGFNYITQLVGIGEDEFSDELPNNKDLFIRCTMECDGEQHVAFFYVHNDDNPNCNPCLILPFDGPSPPFDIDNEILEVVSAYPNPSGEFMDVKYKVYSEGVVSFYSSSVNGSKKQGHFKKYSMPGEYSFRLDLSNLDPGLHVCQITLNGVSVARQFVRM